MNVAQVKHMDAVSRVKKKQGQSLSAKVSLKKTNRSRADSQDISSLVSEAASSSYSGADQLRLRNQRSEIISEGSQVSSGRSMRSSASGARSGARTAMTAAQVRDKHFVSLLKEKKSTKSQRMKPTRSRTGPQDTSSQGSERVSSSYLRADELRSRNRQSGLLTQKSSSLSSKSTNAGGQEETKSQSSRKIGELRLPKREANQESDRKTYPKKSLRRDASKRF